MYSLTLGQICQNSDSTNNLISPINFHCNKPQCLLVTGNFGLRALLAILKDGHYNNRKPIWICFALYT